MKVLISAYACEPGKGSEPEVGLRIILAAASRHDVWVLTRSNNLEPLRAFLSGHPLRDRITLHGVDDEGVLRRLKKPLRGVGTQLYYRHWQRLAAIEAGKLSEEISFDLVHHATFASYWSPIGVAAVDRPLVVGPVGGGVGPPLSLIPELGIRGFVTDGIRLVVRSVMARLSGSRRDLEKARVILFQNVETFRKVGSLPTGRLLSNATSVDLGELLPATGPRLREILFTGRLIPLKGAVTAVRTLSMIEDDGVRLVLIGDGPERRRIAKLARRLGVEDRVDLLGWQLRDVALARVRLAGVYLHTAVHDEASLSVAEALTQGTPVVSYDHGGPAQVMSGWPAELSTAVTARSRRNTVRRLAAACEAFLASPPPIVNEPLNPIPKFSDALLDAYEEALHDE